MIPLVQTSGKPRTGKKWRGRSMMLQLPHDWRVFALAVCSLVSPCDCVYCLPQSGFDWADFQGFDM